MAASWGRQRQVAHPAYGNASNGSEERSYTLSIGLQDELFMISDVEVILREAKPKRGSAKRSGIIVSLSTRKTNLRRVHRAASWLRQFWQEQTCRWMRDDWMPFSYFTDSCHSGRRAKSCSLESAHRRADEFRKTQHLVQLAQKFKQPVLVCFIDPQGSHGVATIDWDEGLDFSKHLLSQWLLRVPIILLMLTAKTSGTIFDAWLADKSLALDKTRYVLALQNQEVNRRFEVDTKTLEDCNV